MKRFSLYKVLTLVGVFVFGVNVWAETKEECIAKKYRELKASCTQTDPKDKQACLAIKNDEAKDHTECAILESTSDKKAEQDRSRQDKKDFQGECKSAYADWSKDATSASSACRAISTQLTQGTSCLSRLKSCRTLISGAFAAFNEGEDESSSSTAAFLTLLQSSVAMRDAQKSYTNQQIENMNTVDVDASEEAARLAKTPQCIKAFNSKAKREAEKEYQTEKQKLEKEIEEEKKKINDANAKLREKSTTIQSKITEVQKKLDDEMQSITSDSDAQKNKQQNEALKDIGNTNALNMEILTLQDQITNTKFKHAQTMMQFASDKIDMQCESALDTAKTCMSRSAKGEKFAQQDTCAPFAFSARGTKAIGDLKKKITQIRKACFEQATVGAQSAEQGQKMTMNALERQLQQKRNDLDLNAKKLAESQAQNERLSAQAKKKEESAKTNTDKQIEDLRKEVLDLTTSTKETIDTATARVTKIKADVENLTIKKKFDVAPIIEEAEEAIDTAETKRVAAEQACCAGDKNDWSNECKQVVNAPTNSSPANSEKAAKARKVPGKDTTGK